MERQKTEKQQRIFIVKVSGSDPDFINGILDYLKRRYVVAAVSRLKRNDDGSGYHAFATLVNTGDWSYDG